MRGVRERGSALILSLVIAAVLALLATAFIITARTERRAAVNTLYGAQAEAACRAGLASAIYQIELSADTYAVTPQHLPAWHSHFFDASGPDLCLDMLSGKQWVEHYDASLADAGMTAKEVSLVPTTPFKRQKGFSAKYYVAVADLDGKLHCNPRFLSNLLTDPQTDGMVAALGLPASAEAALSTDATANWSLGQLRTKLIAAGITDDSGTSENELNLGEKFFTTYPRVLDFSGGKGAISAELGRININTARKEVLKAILSQISALAAGHDSALADYLAAKRPFANRRKLEDAIYDVGPAGTKDLPTTADRLSERELNNILNSLNGNYSSIYATDGNVTAETEGTSGMYKLEFDAGVLKTQDQGATDATTFADTWGTEVKFTSRFFHIYTLGRTLAENGRVVAERRMHAIYDSETNKVLWLRWNFGPKANMTDN